MISIIVYSLWFSSEVILKSILKSGTGDKQGYDKGSMKMMWITIGVGITMGIISARYFRFPDFYHLVVLYIGLSIIIVGMIIRFTSIWQLGRFFTVDITLRTDHKIIQSGLYKLLRHPSYSGMLISFLGFGLSLNSWISLAVVILPVIFAVVHRMNVEEEFLINEFGIEYKDYMKKTFRIVPYIY